MSPSEPSWDFLFLSTSINIPLFKVGITSVLSVGSNRELIHPKAGWGYANITFSGAANLLDLLTFSIKLKPKKRFLGEKKKEI